MRSTVRPAMLGALSRLTPLVSVGLLSALLTAYLVHEPATVEAAGTTEVVGLEQVQSVAYTSAVRAAATRTPRVTVIGTGGTLAGTAPARDSFTSYRSGQIPIADLVAQIQPEIGAVAEVNTVQFGNAGSGGYTIAQFHALTAAVETAMRGSDAVVVTSGTDTMEEFAYWLDLTVQSRKPVVMTGAMRPTLVAETGETVFGADGPANLYNAIRLAASQVTYCFGTVLMLNDEFHAARDVTKTSTTRMDTFQSRELGVLGWVDGPNIKVGRAPARVQQCDEVRDWPTPFDLSRISAEDLPRTEVVHSYQQAGGEAITAFAAAGVEGIVTAGTGAGGVSRAQSQARQAAVEQGVVFVSTSRVGSGSVSGGSGAVIPGDDLLPQKARLLLMLSLAFAPEGDVEQVREWVTTVGDPEFDTTGAVGRPGGKG